MSGSDPSDRAVGVLQELGLKEYEAKSFVGLSRLDSGTAKQLSDLTGVPRTRVYDAVRNLDANGLVEIQHSSPQRYRAVPLDEAIQTLRDRYDERVDRLRTAIEESERVEPTEDEEVQEVWALRGAQSIENRANELIEGANEEVVLVVGTKHLLSDDLVEALQGVPSTVDLVVGAGDTDLEEQIHASVPRATTFVSGLEWLTDDHGGEDTAIGRLLLVDRSTVLVSSIVPETGEEHAVFAGGFGNGLIVLARRLMAQGLLGGLDPGEPDAETP